MIEKKVDIKTADGVADCEFFHSDGAVAPAIIMYTDIGGLRPVFRDMARRLVGQGFGVLVPNPFYRVSRLPVYHHPFEFGEEKTMARIGELRPFITAAGTMRDAEAFVGFLSGQKEVKGKIGATGYCMGGGMALRTAGAVPDKVGAAASFHGGNLATTEPDSPHLLAPKIKAQLHLGYATDDRSMPPEQIERLETALKAAHVTFDSHVYAGAHGWCIKDHTKAYNEAEAERAWSAMVSLFKKAL